MSPSTINFFEHKVEYFLQMQAQFSKLSTGFGFKVADSKSICIERRKMDYEQASCNVKLNTLLKP